MRRVRSAIWQWWESEPQKRLRYALRLWFYIGLNAQRCGEPRMPFAWFKEAYDQRQENFRGWP